MFHILINFIRCVRLKYPPKAKVIDKRRLNDVNESVTYLSLQELSTYIELDIDYYQPFCISEWKYIKNEIAFFIIGVKAQYKSISKEHLKAIEFFNKILTSPQKSYYNATIALAHKIFKKLNCITYVVSSMLRGLS